MTKFSDLALDPRVLQAVTEAGYETPTPIQAEAIPHALQGRDVLGIAQTGTGKTASFTLPMITLLGQGRARARMPRSLVLAPTRELAAQVAENFDIYAKYTKLTKALLIGGVAFGEQDKLIDRGVDVLIATPGRLLDHFERGKLLLTGVQIMVVDEADRMLDMGFIPDIERIFQLTPPKRQTMFYSATMAPEIERITKTFLKDPAKIEVARQATASLTITQSLIEVKPVRKDRSFGDKRSVLRALIRAEGEACTNAIIFCNRKMDVDVVAKSLKSHGFNAAPIHGDLEQSMRMKTLDAFRDGSLHLLVASDVAARGLDIPAVSHVFNFDVPSHPEDYVHRIGRTGRAGRLGKALTISVPSDEKYLKAIESLIKTEIPRGALPEGFEPDTREGKPDRPREERKGRERGGRSRDRDRPVKAHDESAPMEPLVATPKPEAIEDTPREERREDRREPRADRRREDRGERHERGETRVEARGETRSDVRSEARTEGRNEGRSEGRGERRDDRREPREERRDDRRDYRRDRDLGPAVIGMGDHVPDFILRSFALKPSRTEELEDATGTEG
ncbi:DEAD/DEAH box helicase [Tabrizicola sp.]|uniref:DEAD/DEAH box helicase n=1 Tax=Tabrizicola sp. TaxID=2005166 RepID=UPI0027323581|nr:DEAD/DEAH box helicase [Tabrizicola sp.]MDP3197915.1 DEAD/DEAH box helicase [Tabrizicola sp.]